MKGIHRAVFSSSLKVRRAGTGIKPGRKGAQCPGRHLGRLGNVNNAKIKLSVSLKTQN